MPRSEYSTRERIAQARWKRASHELPDGARCDGEWKGIACGHLLPIEYAENNLWASVRAGTTEYFRRHGIAWHDGDHDDYGARREPGPSPNLLDSQVCALNFWWGLGQSPAALAAALARVFDDVRTVVAPHERGILVAPEWIGMENYLGERGDRSIFCPDADLRFPAAQIDRNLVHGGPPRVHLWKNLGNSLVAYCRRDSLTIARLPARLSELAARVPARAGARKAGGRRGRR